jgi:hypothetical protein
MGNMALRRSREGKEGKGREAERVKLISSPAETFRHFSRLLFICHLAQPLIPQRDVDL